MFRTILLSAAALLCLTGPAMSGGPSSDEVEQALAASLRQRKVNHSLKVDRLHGCFPQARRNEWLCLVEYPGRSGRPLVDELVFRRSAQQWTVDPDADADPLCPPQDVAQAAFQTIRNDARLKITEDAGSGTLSESRGLLRDKKGPLRLACTYEVETGLGLELGIVAYSSYQNGRYVIDPDLDVIPK